MSGRGTLGGLSAARGCLLLAGLACLWPCAGADAGPAAHSIVLLDDHLATESDPGCHELLLYIEAALSPFPVDVAIERSDEAGLEAAASAARVPDVLAVVWLDRDQVGFLVPALGEEAVSRQVSAGRGAARFETTAAILLSELMPVLVDVFGTPPTRSPSGPVATAESLDTPARPEAEAPAADPEPGVRFLASVAYLASPLMPDHGYLHGVCFGIGASAGRHLHVMARFDLDQPAHIGAPGSGATFARGMVRLGVYLAIPIEGGDLGPAVSVVGEIWRVGRLDYVPADPEAERAHASPGVSASMRVRLRVLDWLVPFAEMGVDAFFAVDRVTYGDEVLLRRGQVQPHLAVGVMIALGK